MKAKKALDKWVENLSWYSVLPIILIDIAATPVDVIGVAIPFAGTITSSIVAGVLGFIAVLIGQWADKRARKDSLGMALISGFLVAIPLPLATIALGGVKLFTEK